MKKINLWNVKCVLIVFLLARCSTNKITIENKLIGVWQYEQISNKGIIKDASDLNECGYKEVIEIGKFSKKIETREFNSENVELSWIGKSSKKMCMLDPDTFNYKLVSNGCPTEWYRDVNKDEQLYAISEGRINKYKLIIINQDSIILAGTKFKEYSTEAKTLDQIIQLRRRAIN